MVYCSLFSNRAFGYLSSAFYVCVFSLKDYSFRS
uniref:Uncharacterized protein n=1 Tax=Rhizophora mucronata TaxID=61149 RepID=A0A2P2KSL0_RHIMU